MGLAVLVGNSGPIQHQRYRKALHTYVVQHLIVAALQEGRVYEEVGFQASCGHSGAHGNAVFFRDADVEVTGRIGVPESGRPSA